MRGLGTIINVIAVLAGSGIGLFFKSGLKQRFQDILMQACGIATIFIGIGGALGEMMTLSDGKLISGCGIRLIRDGIVVYTGKLGSLRRFKDDVKEVVTGYECGITIANYNDIKVGDTLEAYQEQEVAQEA